MGTEATGVVRGKRSIQVDAPLPYEEGAHIVMHIEPAANPIEQTPDARRLLTLVGMGHGGSHDVAENKHRYLADAYSVPDGEPPA